MLNDILKSERTLYESVTDLTDSKKDMSDKDVKAMQLGSVLAKQMSPSKEAA